MRPLFTSFFLLFGSLFAFLAAFGAITMPDVYTRMHAVAKSGTLGVGCFLIGAAIHFNQTGITTRASLVVVFLFLTIPVATHIVARAAYLSKTPLWDKTVIDEMRDHCDSGEYNTSCSFDELGSKK